MGMDETMERRRGATSPATGLDRAPVRSGHRPVVQASGVRWVSVRRLVPLPWATRFGAFPVLTGQAPAGAAPGVEC
jgi:hypothetical protein